MAPACRRDREPREDDDRRRRRRRHRRRHRLPVLRQLDLVFDEIKKMIPEHFTPKFTQQEMLLKFSVRSCA